MVTSISRDAHAQRARPYRPSCTATGSCAASVARSSGPSSARRKWNVLGDDPDQLGAAAVELQLDAVAVRQKASSVATAASACGGIRAAPSRAEFRR